MPEPENEDQALLKHLYELLYALSQRDRRQGRWVTDGETWNAILRIKPASAYPSVAVPDPLEPDRWTLLGLPVEFDNKRDGIVFEVSRG